MSVASDFYGCRLTTTASSDPGVHRDNVATAFSILKPARPPRAMIRVGGSDDGAYLLPADLSGISACYSPGVNNRKQFEDELCEKFRIECHMCDFSSDVNSLTTPLLPGLQTFEKLWLDVDEGANSISLEGWMRRHASDKGDLLLQMDIEGAEYRNILGTPDQVLNRFRVFVVELHGLQKCFTTPGILSDVLLPFLLKLRKSFVCIHAHANNYGLEFTIPELGANMGDVMELTFVRRDWYVSQDPDSLCDVVLPHELDIRPNARKQMPIVLNDKWISGAISLEARVRVLEDELVYLRAQHESHVSQFDDINNMLAGTLNLFGRAGRDAIVRSSPDVQKLEEVAVGRRYQLSTYSGGIDYGSVPREKVNYFFHTDFGANQSITIDLERARAIRRVVISNRRDACFARARMLFVILHIEPDRQSGRVAAVNLPRGFLLDGSEDATIDVVPTRARFVTVISPLRNYLHLSKITVFAEAVV
jgi:hypothetical protein